MATTPQLKDLILDLSRQNKTTPLSNWFDNQLNNQIINQVFFDKEAVNAVGEKIVSDLKSYKDQTSLSTVVLGMSGGVDSALTAALFRAAGWNVIGVTMPIDQDPIETQRGIDACNALSIKHLNLDLSPMYQAMLAAINPLDPSLNNDWDCKYPLTKAEKIRKGNIRARLRMITLYNLASKEGGLVASTDNYSELVAGFWTRFGDEGDLAPLRSLMKSWEVPLLASIYDVPEDIWRANPTDGLGVDKGDEAQFGFTYLELDIMVNEMLRISESLEFSSKCAIETFKEKMQLGRDKRAIEVFDLLTNRLSSSWFKRFGTIQLYATETVARMVGLARLDNLLFNPEVVK